jgi:hypothetical protein
LRFSIRMKRVDVYAVHSCQRYEITRARLNFDARDMSFRTGEEHDVCIDAHSQVIYPLSILNMV